MERRAPLPARGEKEPLRRNLEGRGSALGQEQPPPVAGGSGGGGGGGGGSGTSTTSTTSTTTTKKPKFHLNIKTLTDDVFDRFSSMRMPGNKKDRPTVLHLKQPHSSSSDWSASADVDNFVHTPLSETEILALFEKMMEDMNLNEDRKAPLREKDIATKKKMVIQYMNTASTVAHLRNSKQILPQEFIYELKTGTPDEKFVSCLESLRVSLTSNPVSWVEKFGRDGLGLLLDILERLLETKHQDNILKKIQHKIIQCLKAFMNNKYGLERIMSEQRSFLLLVKAIDSKQINMMTDILKLLSAMCIIGDENILENILEALTAAAEERNGDRFRPIVEGLQGNSVHLQIACMQLINALVTSPDDLDFRLHIRNEFMRCGLKEQLPKLNCIKNDALDIQLKVFSEHTDEDKIDFSHRLEDIRLELDEVNEVYNVVWSTVKETSAEGYFLSILQHLLLIRNDHCIRPLYFKLIDECVSQIVLHRTGVDPDFSYRKRLDVDFSHLMDICVEQKKTEELEERTSELLKKFENEFLAHQETKAQLQKAEEKIIHLQGGKQLYNCEIGSVKDDTFPRGPSDPSSAAVPPDLESIAKAVPPPPPPPPPLPPSFNSSSGKATPFGPSPPPPPPPPPPPLQGLIGAQCSPPPHVLPFGLKPKKEFKPEVTMKRLNWSQINPHEMNENCFWITANDGKYDDADLLCKLELTFCCQKNAKNDYALEEKKPIKKRIKELKILDSKVAQNLSIYLGSFRVPYEEIKRMILEIDEAHLSESMVQNLIKHLPEENQLDELSKLKSEYKNLSEPEQFAIVMSNVKRLKSRLSAILFKLQFEEQVNSIKPDIMAVSAACEEIRNSRSFGHLLELVLLMGNYMNAGSRNAQTFGFNLCSLCKLKDTKSADQKTTLLHFLVEICEKNYPTVLNFVDDLQHLDKASRVSVENLEKNLKQMERQLKQLERDLETFPLSEDIHDKFLTKMSIFAIQTKEEFQKLFRLYENMEKLYQNVMDYYAVDLKKVSVEEFLIDLNNFRTMFMQAAKDNMRRKEIEEKQKRARIAREKAEKEKLERQQKKQHLLEMKTECEETGVMDSLLEALQSGAAFQGRRNRAARFKDVLQNLSPTSDRPVLQVCNHGNLNVPENIHTHPNVYALSARNPVSKDLNREMETNSPAEKKKAAGKKAINNGENSTGKEMEQAGFVPKGEVMPEVEALLARLRAL